MGQDAKEFGVLEAQVWETGIVALTGNYKFVVINDLDEPRPKIMADAGTAIETSFCYWMLLDMSIFFLKKKGLKEAPHCWAIIPPNLSLSRHVEILVAIENTLLSIDVDSAKSHLATINQGPFAKIDVAPNGRFVALFSAPNTPTGGANTGGGSIVSSGAKLYVVSSDMQKVVAEFSTNTDTIPLQMAWCGIDSVVIHWEDTILMVGPYGDWIKYTYEGVVHLYTEVDGVVIVSPGKIEFLEKVPGLLTSAVAAAVL